MVIPLILIRDASAASVEDSSHGGAPYSREREKLSTIDVEIAAVVPSSPVR